jgi:hypothetical protein
MLQSTDGNALIRVTLNELHRAFEGGRQVLVNLKLVNEPGPGHADEPRTAKDGVRKMRKPIAAKQKDCPLGRNLTPLMSYNQPKRASLGFSESLPELGKQLGSSSEVNCFRVEVRTGLFVKEDVPGQAFDSGGELRSSPPVG